MYLDWATGRRARSREDSLLFLAAPFEGTKIGAHFGAHLDKKPSFSITHGERVKTSRKVHEY
jgi:hypothetical protein